MPGFPVAACEPCNFTSTDQQPSPLDDCPQLSAEERLVAERSLSVYCKPVEFYNVLRRRARKHPLFLPRCLGYRIMARQKKRIQLSVLLSWSDEETQNVFPLHIILATRLPNNEDTAYSAVYLVSQKLNFQDSSDIDGNKEIKANFVLHEVNKLAVEARSCSFLLVFFATEGSSNSSSRVIRSLWPSDSPSHESRGEKNCLYGKIPFQSIYMAWDNSSNFRWGEQAEIMANIDLLPCILKYDLLNKGRTITIQDLRNSEIVSTSKKVQIKIFAEAFGAVERFLNHTNANNDVPSSSRSHAIRLKEGRVTFNYRYYQNRLQRTEVTEDFSCPFCMLKCVSYKGLRCHLFASHDLFNFEFSASGDCMAVHVSVKHDIWRPEIIADGVDPRFQTFILRGKRNIWCRPEDECFEEVQDVTSPALANDADPPVLTTDTDPWVLVNDVDSVLAIDTDPSVLAIDADPHNDVDSVLAMDADPPVLAMDAEPPVIAIDAEPPVSAIDTDPPVSAIEMDPPVLATDADPPVLATDADPPVIAMDVDPPVLAADAFPSILATNADPPVLATNADPIFLESETPLGDIEFSKKAGGNSATISGTASANIVSDPNPECVPPISGHEQGQGASAQVNKKGKLPFDQFDPQIIAGLKKRQFYHSQRGQPMSLEYVLSNVDSEDDDDEVRAIEDKWRLNRHDATEGEKQFMFMWNSFIWKQHVRVDSHMRWACKAFSIMHGPELIQSRELSWYWLMFRLKLYNLGLIDAKIINDVGIILEEFEKHKSNPEIPRESMKKILVSPRKTKGRKRS